MNKRKINTFPLKIAVLGHKTIPSRQGGIEIVVEELTVRMAKLGHKITVYRGLGSIDIAAVARSVLLVGRDRSIPYYRVMLQIKNNLAPEGKAYVFELNPDYGFRWIGQEEYEVEDLLAHKTKTESKLDKAKDYLRLLLNKVLLLELTGEPISIIGKNYSNYIMAYIIENNFDVHDENRLYKYFSKYNEIIQQAICDVAVSRIDNIISDSSIVLDDILLSKLLQNRNCSTDDRISLWAKVLPGLD